MVVVNTITGEADNEIVFIGFYEVITPSAITTSWDSSKVSYDAPIIVTGVGKGPDRS